MTSDRPDDPTPFTFTVSAHRAADGAAWRDLARRVEDLGYTGIAVPDHRGDAFAPLPALAVAAAATTTLRVGTLVLCNGLRPSLLLAQELTTLDVLSSGRLDWGMGAGWLPDDFTPLDLAFEDPATRVDRLMADVTRMLGAFAAGDERGAQHPHPPLLIGAAHERLVRFAAVTADVVHLSPLPSSRQFGPHAPTIDVCAAMDRQVGWVHDAAAARGRPPTLAATALPALVTDDVDGAAQRLATPTGLTPAEVRVSPHVLLGTIDEICETLQQRRVRWGLSAWTVPDASIDAFAPVVARLTGR